MTKTQGFLNYIYGYIHKFSIFILYMILLIYIILSYTYFNI